LPDDLIVISGDSSKLELREPAKQQIQYREDFSDFNQDSISISGIYSNSEGHSGNAGNSGNIDINTGIIALYNEFASTSSQNAGGGRININASDLLLLKKGNYH